ncbi:hypothetical protein [uncultured Bacteroides sp.]|nr:hypothetical protein [uncultured Bacteroides sp.]
MVDTEDICLRNLSRIEYESSRETTSKTSSVPSPLLNEKDLEREKKMLDI